MLILSGPFQSAWAAIIETESVINAKHSQIAREYVNNLLTRKDIRLALVSQGIDPQEAKARIEGLSDAEVNEIANKLDQLPAGASETSVLIIMLVFLIFLIMDFAGILDTPDSE
jgi:hypothetical protein